MIVRVINQNLAFAPPPGSKSFSIFQEQRWGSVANDTWTTIATISPEKGRTSFVTELELIGYTTSKDMCGHLIEIPRVALTGLFEMSIDTDGKPISLQGSTYDPFYRDTTRSGAWGGLLQSPISVNNQGAALAWSVNKHAQIKLVQRTAPRIWIPKFGLRCVLLEIPTTEWNNIEKLAVAGRRAARGDAATDGRSPRDNQEETYVEQLDSAVFRRVAGSGKSTRKGAQSAVDQGERGCGADSCERAISPAGRMGDTHRVPGVRKGKGGSAGGSSDSLGAYRHPRRRTRRDDW